MSTAKLSNLIFISLDNCISVCHLETIEKLLFCTKKICSILLNRVIKFHGTFENPLTSKLNSREIFKFLSLNREIKFGENFFPKGM